MEALRKFEPAADEEYRLGRGDEITIDFSGRPELQAKLVVGPDGRITLPVAGEVMVANLTREQAASKVEEVLSAYYSNLSAMITVTKYTANRVLVLGAVDHPGPVTFDGSPTLLEAITRGGLPTMGPDKRPQIPDQCTIYRGSGQVMTVQLRSLIDSGSPLADLQAAARRRDLCSRSQGTVRVGARRSEPSGRGARCCRIPPCPRCWRMPAESLKRRVAIPRSSLSIPPPEPSGPLSLMT